MKSICVYCGSSPGASPAYAEAARKLAQEMVKNNIALVYGGGNVGLMGIIAMIASPTIGGLLQLALSRTREFDADYGAALLTGDPDPSVRLAVIEAMAKLGDESCVPKICETLGAAKQDRKSDFAGECAFETSTGASRVGASSVRRRMRTGLPKHFPEPILGRRDLCVVG